MNPPNNLVPLVDADIIVYRTGFASKEHEPLGYTLNSTKTVLEAIYNTFPNAPYRKVYLTGKDNYRDKVATIKVYKGNRDPHNKPEYYDEIRQYIMDFHNGIMVEGMEADDALGIEQWKNKDRSTCIVSIDKDLLCIPGWHFNWVKGEFHYQTLAAANYTFWKQVLTGDTTDNIQGIPKVGTKTADKILAGTDGTWTDLQSRVQQAYEKHYGADYMRYMHENATLVWMQREEGVNYDGRGFDVGKDSTAGD